METAECLTVIEKLIGMFRTGLGSLPARIAGRDLQERRRIDAYCNEILKGIHDAATAEAEALERETGKETDDDAA